MICIEKLVTDIFRKEIKYIQQLKKRLQKFLNLKIKVANMIVKLNSVDLTVQLHVLICPKREVKRVADLTDDENIELWRISHKLGRQLESYHNATSLTFCIQVRQFGEI